MNNDQSNFIIGILSAVFAWFINRVAFFIGGFDTPLTGLIVFMVVDYATGLIYAGSVHNIASHKSFVGIRKKVDMLLLVIVGHWLDILAGSSGFMRNTIIMLLVATEGISIVENLGKMGIKVPVIFKDTFATFRVDLAEKEDHDDDKDEIHHSGGQA